MGKNVMPRVAALLDVMQISEVVEIVSADTFKRPIYAGNAIQTVQSSDAKKIITVRTSSFQAAGEGGSASVESVDAAADGGPFQLRSRTGSAHSEPARTDLCHSIHSLSGGRSRGSAPRKKFVRALMLPIADKLGCGGWGLPAPPSMRAMRRTTGRVRPRPARSSRLTSTFAVGISGAHPASRRHEGFQGHSSPSTRTRKRRPPSSRVADYGLVGDLFTLLPELEKGVLMHEWGALWNQSYRRDARCWAGPYLHHDAT